MTTDATDASTVHTVSYTVFILSIPQMFTGLTYILARDPRKHKRFRALTAILASDFTRRLCWWNYSVGVREKERECVWKWKKARRKD